MGKIRKRRILKGRSTGRRRPFGSGDGMQWPEPFACGASFEACCVGTDSRGMDCCDMLRRIPPRRIRMQRSSYARRGEMHGLKEVAGGEGRAGRSRGRRAVPFCKERAWGLRQPFGGVTYKKDCYVLRQGASAGAGTCFSRGACTGGAEQAEFKKGDAVCGAEEGYPLGSMKTGVVEARRRGMLRVVQPLRNGRFFMPACIGWS